MSQRQLKRAANLLLDSVATFTTYELFSYEQCVFYAVSMALVTLPRPDLRKKVRQNGTHIFVHRTCCNDKAVSGQ